MTKTELIAKMSEEIATLVIHKEVAMKDVHSAEGKEARLTAEYNFDIARAKLDEAGYIADNVLLLDMKKMNQAIDKLLQEHLTKYGAYTLV